MKVKELLKYLVYVDPDLDLMVITREEYERLIKKARFVDSIAKQFSCFNNNHIQE